MQVIDPLIQTMTDRNTAHNEVIRLRAILGSFRENLESYLDMTRRSLDAQIKMHEQGHRGGTRAVEDLAQIKALEHMWECLDSLERSTR